MTGGGDSDGRTSTVAGTPLLVAGFLLMALSLRTGIASVPPILTALQQHLGLSAPDASALTALPLLCFGLFAAVASPLSRRFGSERVLFGSGAVLLCGLATRAIFPHSLLFVGTLLVCAAIAPVVGANSITQLESWLPAASIELDRAELRCLEYASWTSSRIEFCSW